FAPDGRTVLASGMVLRGTRDKEGFGLDGYSAIRWEDPELNCTLLDTTGTSQGCAVAQSPDWRWFASTAGILDSLHLDGNVISSDKRTDFSIWLWESGARRVAVRI